MTNNNQYQQYKLAIAILGRMSTTLQQFQSKHTVEIEEIAVLCGVSLSRAYHWRGKVTESQQITLGIVDFVLENIAITFPLLVQWQADHSNN